MSGRAAKDLEKPSEKSHKRRRSRGASLVPNLPSNAFVFSNGEKYTGEYQDLGQGRMERHGLGMQHFTDGRVYNGNWVKDKMCGQGEMTYPSGATYKGDFEHNEYSGFGSYAWPDGSHFTGTFIKNRMNGKGEFVDAKGTTWIGSFSEKAGLKLKIKLS